MSEIDWNQKRTVLKNAETGETYVKVPTGVMLVQIQSMCEPLESVGVFTNAQIDQLAFLEGGS